VLEVARGFDWSALRQETASLSLFSTRRLIDLRMGSQKPGRDGAEALTACAGAITPDTLLLITCGRLDRKSQQTKWYKALDGAGVTVTMWPLEPARLPDWIRERTRQRGKTIDRPAAELIAQRVEGNLLAAAQEIDKLILLVDSETISLEDAMLTVTDSARYDAFALVESSLMGNTARLVRMLRGLRQEGVEPLGVFGPLMWELRRLSSMAHALAAGAGQDRVLTDFHVWPQRRSAVIACLNRLRPEDLSRLLGRAATVDRAAKGASIAGPWELLEDFLLAIAGVKNAFVNGAGMEM
jgi:DNA polymerase-3 subunit delta